MVSLRILVRPKRNIEQDLIIAKVHTGLNEKKRKLSQQRFHEHYGQHSHIDIDDSVFILIEQCETHEQLKEREKHFGNIDLKHFTFMGFMKRKTINIMPCFLTFL